MKEIKNEVQHIVYNDSKTRFMDCNKYLSMCKASMANSSENVYTMDNEKCTPNAKIVHNDKDNSFTLHALTNISRNTEILWMRGRKYY